MYCAAQLRYSFLQDVADADHFLSCAACVEYSKPQNQDLQVGRAEREELGTLDLCGKGTVANPWFSFYFRKFDMLTCQALSSSSLCPGAHASEPGAECGTGLRCRGTFEHHAWNPTCRTYFR